MLSEDLGLYEVFRDGPTAPADVGDRLGLPARSVSVLLAANTCMGILGVKNRQYFIHDAMRPFVLDGQEPRWRPHIPEPGTDRSYDLWKQAILTNTPNDDDLPDWIAHPEGAPGVTAHIPARHGWRILWGETLAEAFDFQPYRQVVDLGGATGGLLIGLTSRYPNLQGIVLDLPYGRASAEEAIRASNAMDRVRFSAGDFFTGPYPDGTDVLVMSHVLHDWDDEHCLQLLKRCYDALPEGCPVIAQEFLLNAEKSGSLLAVFQWFGMMRGTYGDQRTADEIAALMRTAGFRDMETRPIDGEQSIVIGRKRVSS